MLTRGTTTARTAVLAVAVLATTLILAFIPGHRGWFDAGVYYGTVRHWAATGQLYDYVRPGTPYGFTYPPFAAVCMLPMRLLGWHPAIAVGVALSAVATALLLYWIVDPIARRRGWCRWYAFGLAACLCGLSNPVRDTFSFGQVNLLLVALVFADRELTSRQFSNRRWQLLAGVGTGLAAAIKLTPALFIVHLLLTRRWRAAATATATALGATGAGFLAGPEVSRQFWTVTLWDTDRVGGFANMSNQSLQGLIARLGPQLPGRALWVAASLAVLALWAYRLHRAEAARDSLAAYSLTGIACCLVSPITWVHHLVWMLPALVVLADAALDRTRRRRTLLTLCWLLQLVLSSGMVWLWRPDGRDLGTLFGGSAYVLATLGLLLALPIRRHPEEPRPPTRPKQATAPAVRLPQRTAPARERPAPVG
ncbi:glycosyltransferase 87 family protein [Kitasatospora cineracea]|uniref:Alpha-1,2-mannosyltransferase n=1 Tax=Kitasatospora cineracea TaxID=88074 RepID=A0A8G1XB47_9ACTN|nr:glycosyltransferase 87 family protein [Kitasatospora cineracea]ROR33939.1 alpha-1,2-mannosyltransferase [Kitasatospora cineracea]